MLLVIGALVALLLTSTAMADTIQFTLTSGSHTIQFSVPASPTPDLVGPNFFTLNDVPFTLDGSPELARIMNFFDDSNGGGMGICDYANCPLVDLFGAQMFTGPLDHPTLIPGNYNLVDAGDSFLPGDFETVVAVPEPGSFLLIATGILGFTRRLRR
jgi:hypothetical protein